MCHNNRESTNQKKITWWQRATALLTCMSLVISFIVPSQLMLSSQAEEVSDDEPVLICGLEEHVHSEDCFLLTCEDDTEEHEHTDECYEVVCGLEEHLHSDECYDFDDSDEEEPENRSRLTLAPDMEYAPLAGSFNGSSSSKKAVDKSGANKPNTDTKYFETVATSVGGDTHEIAESEITGISITINNQNYSAPDDNGKEISIDGDSVPAQFSITYTIKKTDDGNYVVYADKENGEEGSPCIYYQLPDGIEIPNERYGDEKQIIDSEYTDPDYGHVAGYYSISKDGLIVIQFTQDYIKNKIQKANEFTGNLNFDGTVNRDQTESGDRTISIGGLELKLNFPDKASQVTKEYVKNDPTTVGGATTIEWTIKVQNITNPASLDGRVLEDAQFASNNVTVSPEGVGQFSGNQFIFNEEANTKQEIVFTYTQTITNDEFSQMLAKDTNNDSNTIIISDNTALLKDGDDIISQSRKTVTAGKPSITKEGEPSYKNGEWISSTIYWTIDVTAPVGNTLYDYSVKDAIFAGSDSDGNKLKLAKDYPDDLVEGTNHDKNSYEYAIVVKDEAGNPLIKDTDYTISGDTITFKTGISKAKIVYVTDCKALEKDGSNRKVSNTAVLVYPDGTEGISKKKDIDYSNSAYRLDNKTGSYDYDTNQITWYIGAYIANRENKKIYLNDKSVDFAFKDPALNALEDLSEALKLESADWAGKTTGFYLEKVDKDAVKVMGDDGKEYATLVREVLTDKDGNVLQEDGKDIVVLNVTGGSKNIPEGGEDSSDNWTFLHALRLSYTTPVTAKDLSFEEGQTEKTVNGVKITKNENGSFTFTNTVGNAPRDEKGISNMGGPGTVTKKDRSETYKTLSVSDSDKNKGFYYEDAGKRQQKNEPDTKTLSWTVNLKEDNGFVTEYQFIDTLSTTNADVPHTFVQDKLNLSIKLYTLESKTDSPYTPVAGTDYQLELTDTQLIIKFLKNMDTSYKYAVITYDSIAEVSKIHGTDTADAQWDRASETFTNKAGYHLGSDSKSYTYTNENPENIAKFNIDFTKKWDDGSDTSKRPDYVIVRLQQRKTTTGSDEKDVWHYIYPDSETGAWTVVDDQLNLDDVENCTFTVFRDKNWVLTFKDLPKNTSEQDGDYEYRVVEVSNVDYYKPGNPAEEGTPGAVGYSDIASYNKRNPVLENQRDNSIKKYLVDKNGDRIDKDRLVPSDLEEATNITEKRYILNNANGGDVVANYGATHEVTGSYYYLRYELDIEIFDDKNYTIVDTIPEGTKFAYSLQENSILLDKSYAFNPQTSSNDSFPWNFRQLNNTGASGFQTFDEVVDSVNKSKVEFFYNTDNINNVVFYNVNKNTPKIWYYIRIPKDKMNEMLSSQDVWPVDNTITFDNGGKSTASVMLSTDRTNHEDKSLITKSVVNSGLKIDPITGEVTYQLLVNPEAKKLAPANKSTYDITDVLNIATDDVKADIVNVIAEEITLNEFTTDQNGKYSIKSSTKKADSEITYSYVPGDSSVTQTDISENFVFKAVSNTSYTGGEYQTSSSVLLKKGDELTFTIKGKRKTDDTFPDNAIYFQPVNGKYMANININSKNASMIVYNDDGTFEIEYKYTVTESDETSKLLDLNVFSSSADFVIDDVSVKAIRKKVNDSGELVITVPDSKTLLVTYIYRMTKKSTGDLLKGGDSLTMSNMASIDTGVVSSWDDKKDSTFIVNNDSGTSRTSQYHPSLVKRDIHNYNLEDIGARFYVAYYDSSAKEWVFCKQVSPKTDENNKKYLDLDFGTSDGRVTTAGNEIPNGAAPIDIDPVVDKGKVSLNLTEDLEKKVYKFIEVPTLAGYEGTNITFPASFTDQNGITQSFDTFEALLNDYINNQAVRSQSNTYPYRYFFNNFVSTHYYAYASAPDTAYPSKLSKDDVTKVIKNGQFIVEDNKLVNIKADKTWNGADFPPNAKSRIKLYYAYEKFTNGTFPPVMYEATANALGLLDSNFSGTITLNEQLPAYTWKDLPTAINDRRIYYYVREEMYTLDGTTWFSVQSDGSYRSDSARGTYSSSYDGNGVSRVEEGKTAAEVSISNTSGLYIKKIWLDYYGGTISNNAAELPETIQVQLTGKFVGGESASALLDVYRSSTKLTDDEGWLKLEKIYDFTFSVTDDVYFKKHDDTSDTKYYANAFESIVLTENTNIQVTDYLDENSSPGKKELKELYNAAPSFSSITNGRGTVSITNQKKAVSGITIEAKKNWVGDIPEDTNVTFQLYKTLDDSVTSENFETKLTDDDKVDNPVQLPIITKDEEEKDVISWTAVWENLEQKDKDTKKDWHYFVKEERLTGYLPPTYTNQGRTGGGTITIINTPVSKTEIQIVKHWTTGEISDWPSPIYVDLYRETETTEPTTEPPETPSTETIQGVSSVSWKDASFRLTAVKAKYRISFDPVEPEEDSRHLTLNSVKTVNAMNVDTSGLITDSTGTYYKYEVNRYQGNEWFVYPTLENGLTYSKIKIINGSSYTLYWDCSGWQTGSKILSTEFINGEYDVSNLQPSNGGFTFCWDNQDVTEVRLYVSSPFSLSNIKTSIDMSKDNNDLITIATANKDITSVTSSDASVEIVSFDNQEIKVRGKNAGTGKATITVVSGSDSETFTVTVNQIQLNNKSADIIENRLVGNVTPFEVLVTHTNGNEPDIKPKDSDIASAVWSDGKITVTPKNIKLDVTKSQTFEVSYGGVTRNIILNINPETLTAEIKENQKTVNVGEKFYLKVNKKNFTVSKIDSSCLSIDTQNPQQDTDGSWLYPVTAIGEKDVEQAKIILTNPDKNSEKPIELAIDVKMVYHRVDVDVDGKDHVVRIELVKDETTGEYTCSNPDLLKNLPVTTDDGVTYHYYIKEDTSNLKGYVPWKYSSNNGNAPKGNGTMTLHVHNGSDEEQKPETSTLPEAGGTGTAPYRTAGTAIMLTAITIPYIRRKRRNVRKSA